MWRLCWVWHRVILYKAGGISEEVQSAIRVGKSSTVKTYAACIYDTFIGVYETTRCYVADCSNPTTVHFKGNVSKFQSSATLLQARSFDFPFESLVSSTGFKSFSYKYSLPCGNLSLSRGSLQRSCTGRTTLFVILELGIYGAYITQHSVISYTLDMSVTLHTGDSVGKRNCLPKAVWLNFEL